MGKYFGCAYTNELSMELQKRLDLLSKEIRVLLIHNICCIKPVIAKGPQMVAKLIVTLEQGMQREMLNNQSFGVAACARQIISIEG